MLPGQTFVPFVGVTGQALHQIKDIAFTVDVYVVDSALNLVPGAAGTIQLTTSDPVDIEPPPAPLASGHVALTVNPNSFGTWTATATGSAPVPGTSSPYTVAARITTVAGNGASVSNGDGLPATQAGVAIPYDVAADAFGNFFIADAVGRVRKVSRA